MAATLSQDGLRIEGVAFPDPDPPTSTMRFSLLRERIIAIQEYRADDATGTGTVALVCMVWYVGGSILVPDSYEDLMTLWTTP